MEVIGTTDRGIVNAVRNSGHSLVAEIHLQR